MRGHTQTQCNTDTYMLPVAGKDRISSERLLLRQVVCSRETHAVSVEGVDFCWVFVKLQEK